MPPSPSTFTSRPDSRPAGQRLRRRRLQTVAPRPVKRFGTLPARPVRDWSDAPLRDGHHGGPPGAMTACLRNLAAARETLPEGEAIEGFHVEGPHNFRPKTGPRGAHPRHWGTGAGLRRVPPMAGRGRRAGAAGSRFRPSWPEAPRYIERITAEGTVASIGHTQATAEQIADAVSAGATLSTHLGNGAHPVTEAAPQLHLGPACRRPPDGLISSWTVSTWARRFLRRRSGRRGLRGACW